MMSLSKTMETLEKPPRNQTEHILFERIDESYPKMLNFIEFGPLCQKLWAFMSSFTMTTHQIWSCDVTLAANSKIFIFRLILY